MSQERIIKHGYDIDMLCDLSNGKAETPGEYISYTDFNWSKEEVDEVVQFIGPDAEKARVYCKVKKPRFTYFRKVGTFTIRKSSMFILQWIIGPLVFSFIRNLCWTNGDITYGHFEIKLRKKTAL